MKQPPRPRTPPITGSWRVPSRDPQRLTTDVHTKRRTSSLPRRLLWGRLARGMALFGLAVLAAVGVVQVASWAEKTHALPVRTVAVRAAPGAPALDEQRADEVRSYAGVVKGQPLFSVDPDAVAARVLEHPFIASAVVRRVPPDGVEITVTPRAPVAALSAAGAVYLVDARGGVMKSARAGDGLDLPVITGLAAADVASGAAAPALCGAVGLLAAFAAAGAPGGPAGEVTALPGGGFDLVLEDGTRVRLGRDKLEDKVARLDAVVRRLQSAGRTASFIYLDDDRRPERAAVRLRPERESATAGGDNQIPRERG